MPLTSQEKGSVADVRLVGTSVHIRFKSRYEAKQFIDMVKEMPYPPDELGWAHWDDRVLD